MTEKTEAGRKVAKARLVAKGYQDEDAASVRTDSPTCSKEGLKMALAIIATNKLKVNALDIKTAFLQSQKMDRPVFLVPPIEAKFRKDHIWKLNKCVYGLNDASRQWYLTMKEELIKYGAEVSKYDEAIFTWHLNGKLHGVISTHVDDLMWGGSKVFKVSVIDKLKAKFKVKTEESVEFRYLGLDVEQRDGYIALSQNDYVRKLDYLPAPEKLSDEPLSPREETLIRQANGKLNWIATQTRPDLSFDVSECNSIMKRGKMECFRQVNKNIKKAKMEKSQIFIPSLESLRDLSIVGYSDASFANLDDGGSQGGYIIFVVGRNGNYFPLHWQSKRIRRVVKSTQAAETLAMVDLAEACVYYRKLICDLLRIDPLEVKIICKTDNSGMHFSTHSSTQILDKRLRIEMAILREMIAKKEIDDITWVPSENQVADIFTKRGVPSHKVLRHLMSTKAIKG